MKLRKKGLIALALCAALVLALAIPAFGSPSAVHLMGVNDTVIETTAENMPTVIGGVLYVPYIMLSPQASGINLGVSAVYSPTRRTVLVSSGRQRVMFDIQDNTAQDMDGNPIQARAMVRNTMAFLPIDYLCSYFGTISCTRTPTPYGTLVRVTNNMAVLNDQEFVAGADNQLADNLRRYQAAASSSAPGPFATSQPGTSAAPSQAELYLALRAGSSAAECAQMLEGRGLRALFLLAPEDLPQEDGLVRRLAGAGHTLGLALDGEDAKSCLAEAARGRELLAAAARCHAIVVSAPNLDGEGRKALAEAGYVLWDAGVRGEDFTAGRAMVEALDPQRMNYVELECGEGGAAFLRSALGAMDVENCQLYQPTAPALA